MCCDIFFFAQQDYESRHDFIKLARIKILVTCIISFARVYGLMSGIKDPLFYISIFIFEKFIFICLLFVLSNHLHKYISLSRKAHVNIKDIKFYSSNASSLFLSAINYFLLTRVDQYLIVSSGQQVELANYSISVRIVEACYFIPAILANIFMAKISDPKLEVREKYLLSIREIKSLTVFGLCSLLLFNCLVLAIKPYVLVEFEYFQTYVFAYSFLLPALFCYNILKKLVIYLGHFRYLWWTMASALISNLVCSIIIFQYFGTLGLIAVTVVCFYGICAILLWICFKAGDQWRQN